MTVLEILGFRNWLGPVVQLVVEKNFTFRPPSSLPPSVMNAITNYTKYLSPTSLARQPSAIRKLMPLMKRPGMVSLGGGLPNPSMFPFRKIQFDVSLPYSIDTMSLVLEGNELEEALQYSPTPGLPRLVWQLRDIQNREHHINNLLASDDENTNALFDVSITIGSQDGLTKAFEMLLHPPSDVVGKEKDDCDEVLLESPTYSGALAFLQPFGVKLNPINTDNKGLDPDHLYNILTSNGSKRRRVLYTIPTAQNPSGITLDNARRRAIYQLACEHDLIILEDDPYYFLHPERESLVSFLQLDAQNCMQTDSNAGKGGRVLRFDSFSKIFSAGMRIGFVTAPLPLLERINLHIQGTNLHNCGVSQAMISKMLDAWGGWDGLDAHLRRVSRFYGMRRDWIIEAAEKHLGSVNGVKWNVPTAGMFLWLQLLQFDDTKSLIEEKAADSNVLFVPGQSFDPLDRLSSYVRASYSTASREDMDVAMKRLADLIRDEK